MGDYKEESWFDVILASAFALGGVYHLNNVSAKITSKPLATQQITYSSWAEQDLRDSVRDYPKAIMNLEKKVVHSNALTFHKGKSVPRYASKNALSKIPYK